MLAGTAGEWETFAQEDPLWAILTDPSKQGGRWKLEEFMAIGAREFASTMEVLQRLNPPVARGAALDFGCGVGRLTYPMGHFFARAVGVDVAPSMIAYADRLKGAVTNVEFKQSAALELPFPDRTFDLVHSIFVLQHIPFEAALNYIREFVRVLRVGGVAYFAVPAQFFGVVGRQKGESRISYGTREAVMLMHCLPISEVAAAVEASGAVIEQLNSVRHDDSTLQTTYVVRRMA